MLGRNSTERVETIRADVNGCKIIGKRSGYSKQGKLFVFKARRVC